MSVLLNSNEICARIASAVISSVFGFYIQSNVSFAANATERIVDPEEDLEVDFTGVVTKEAAGGAIYNSGESGINISGSFIGNQGRAQGGAIFNSGKLGSISATFRDNMAMVNNGDGSPHGGGAIYNSGSIGSIINSTFEGNYGNLEYFIQGGAICNSGSIGTESEGGIINALFKGNKASHYGGAIYNNTASSYIHLISGVFTENSIEVQIGLACGGAIYNEGKIEAIEADFEGNYVCSHDISAINGGTLVNDGTIGSIKGNFIGNYGVGNNMKGGAIYNGSKGVIDSITGTFKDNYTMGRSGDSMGGAIFSNGTVGFIIADFSGNYVETGFTEEPKNRGSVKAQGGAIYCENVTYIEGRFDHNHVKDCATVQGGAISVGGFVGLDSETEKSGIKGSFSDNYVLSEYGNAWGGAIYTNGHIISIMGEFTNNYAQTNGVDVSASGGALAGNGFQLNRIYGTFIGNYARADKGRALGGAIYNNDDGTESIVGVFTRNYAQSGSYARGGAIFNFIPVKELSGQFSGNYAVSEESFAQGGALHNSSTIGSIINSSFTDNYVQGKGNDVHGGAIYTTTGLTIAADGSQSELGNGGAVVISGNWAGSEDNPEAIYLATKGQTLTLNAVNKGSITIDDIIASVGDYTLTLTGDDINSVIALNNDVGSAAATTEKVTLKIGLTSDTESKVFANATLAVNGGVVDTVDGKFGAYKFKKLVSDKDAHYKLDVAISGGKACNDVFDVTYIEAEGVITLSNFVMHEFDEVGDGADSDSMYTFQIIKGAVGGSIQLSFEDALQVVATVSKDMTSKNVLADYFELATTDSANDSVSLQGWRDVLATWAELAVNEGEAKSFIIKTGDTQVLTRDVKALEGTDITIKGESGNTLDLRDHKLLDSISAEQKVRLENLSIINTQDHAMNNAGELTLDSVTLEGDLTIKNGNALSINGHTDLANSIDSDGTEGHRLVIDDASEVYDNETVVNIKGRVSNQNITHAGSGNLADANFTTVTNLIATEEGGVKSFSNFSNNSLDMQGGCFSLGDMGTARLALRELKLAGGAVYVGSSTINLTTETMGGIDARSAVYAAAGAAPGTPDAGAQEPAGSAAAAALPGDDGVIWLNDIVITGAAKRALVHVKFVDETVAYAVKDGKDVARGAEKSGKAVIADKSLLYDWEVTYNDPSAPALGMYTLYAKDFTHEAKAAPVADVTGSYVSMMQVYNYAFAHAELYSVSLAERSAHAAAAGRHGCSAAAATGHGLWLQTYAARENMPLRHGPEVSVDMYGGLIGGDSALHEHHGGWASAYSLYGGYLGSTQKYGSVSIKQHGAAAGATASLYRERFHMAFTATVGTSAADATGRGGREEFDMLMGGLAARAGYSIGFDNHRYTLQPLLMLSYTCFDVHDYTNAGGVKIDAKPTTVLQVHPLLKLTKNTDCSWNPYLSAGYVYDYFSKTRFKANGAELPHMSVKPYAEYSLGVQRTYEELFTLYGQVTGRSGGRRGAEATIGIRRAW